MGCAPFSRWIAILSLLILGSGCGSGSSGDSEPAVGNGSFLETLFPAPSYNVNDGLRVTALADMNEDGLDDVVVAHSEGVGVLLSRGDGTLAPQLVRALDSGARVLAVADFDDDGHIDVAAGGYSNGVSLCLGNGDGTLSEPLPTPAGDRGSVDILIAADVDGDGFQDLVSGSTFDAPALVRGRGDGTFFDLSTEYFGESVSFLDTGDFNSDGAPDLVALIRQGVEFAVIINDGAGGVASDLRYPYGDNSLGIGDLNNDDIDDIAVHDRDEIVTLLSLGDGTFDTPKVQPVGDEEFGATLAVLPMDGDENNDLLVNSSGLGLNLYPGAGNGEYESRRHLLDLYRETELDAAELNGDTFLDLIGSNRFGLVTVFLAAANGQIEAPQGFGFRTALGTDFVLADFDRDELVDAVAAHAQGISYFGGTADSIFTAETSLSALMVKALTAADFNGDGNLDLAAITNEADPVLPILIGDGHANFEETTALALGEFTDHIVSADFNGDGIIDLATSNGSGESFVIHTGQSDGTFSAPEHLSTSSGVTDLISGEFNSDGFADLAVANWLTGTVSFFFGGDGPAPSAGPSISLTIDIDIPGTLTNGPLVLACSDLNADGSDDLAIVVSARTQIFNATLREDRLVAMLGDGNGAFVESTSIPDEFVDGLTTADVTADGIIDLLTIQVGTSQVLVFEGLGDGTFKQPQGFLLGGTSNRIAAADLNNDGVNDIAALRTFLNGSGDDFPHALLSVSLSASPLE